MIVWIYRLVIRSINNNIATKIIINPHLNKFSNYLSTKCNVNTSDSSDGSHELQIIAVIWDKTREKIRMYLCRYLVSMYALCVYPRCNLSFTALFTVYDFTGTRSIQSFNNSRR